MRVGSLSRVYLKIGGYRRLFSVPLNGSEGRVKSSHIFPLSLSLGGWGYYIQMELVTNDAAYRSRSS